MQFLPDTSIKTVVDVLKSNSPTLSVVKKEYGDEFMFAALHKLLINAAKFFNVGQNLDEANMNETARLIANNYYFLKIDDFHLFFDRLKMGKYGKTYNRMDGNVILIALGEYWEERMQIAQEVSQQEHKDFMIEQAKEVYLVKTQDGYVRKNSIEDKDKPGTFLDEYEEVEKRELGTTFTYKESCRIERWLNTEHDAKAYILDSRKSEDDLYKVMDKTAPKLIPDKELRRRSLEEHKKKEDAILNDKTLTELQKRNAIRALVGLMPLNQEEFALSEKHMAESLAKWQNDLKKQNKKKKK